MEELGQTFSKSNSINEEMVDGEIRNSVTVQKNGDTIWFQLARKMQSFLNGHGLYGKIYVSVITV